MAGLSPQIASWLYNVVQPEYTSKQLAYTHMYQFLEVHYGQNLRFKVRTSVYTSSTGSLALLVNFTGTISVSSVSFSIPIRIWVPHNYPYSLSLDSPDNSGVPMVYVVPDPGKGILLRPGNHVDSQGRFYHPFLTAWHRDCVSGSPLARSFSLLELVKVLQNSFERAPPLQEGQVLLEPHITSQDMSASMNRLSLGSGNNSTINVDLAGSFALNGSRLGFASPTRNEATLSLDAPPLPPKAFKEATSPASTASGSSAVPLKYLRPLPLPLQSFQPQPIPLNQHILPQHTTNIPVTNYQNSLPKSTPSRVLLPQQTHFLSSNSYSQLLPPNTYHMPSSNNIYDYNGVQNPPNIYSVSQSPQRTLENSHTPQNSQPKSEAAAPVEVNLMDEQIAFKTTNLSDKLLNAIEGSIREVLANEEPVLAKAETESRKIGALHGQLSHHLQQAIANSENLDKHIDYLDKQKRVIKSSNDELGELEIINSQDWRSIQLLKTQSISLDSLITPDLALVNQLYEVVADIKARKDTIDLVYGTFRNESELINDDNFDAAIKAVRSISRELFWLEITKEKISGIMQL